ncbi:MAG: KamA family radical SAM protein [Bacteriovoracia bacterium]
MAGNQNWTNEFKEAFRNLKDLYRFLEWDLPSEIEGVEKVYPVFVPRNLAKKMKKEGPKGVLAKEFLPHSLEVNGDLNEKGLFDPIGDQNFFKAPQLIHRYKSRALFTPTTICPVLCRYCFRKNELVASEEIFQQDFEKTLSYLSEHPEISEIIFTGGDPFTLSDEKLEKYLESFSAIKTIRDIRFHTRYPIIIPERINGGLLEILSRAAKNFRTVTVAIHANHKLELDETIKEAITKLGSLPIQLLSQTVLLKGVNDTQEDLLELFGAFIELKIRPYYLHHPDPVKGGMHFYLSLEKGRELYASLRKELPGWAIPHYVIDVPGGEGKISAFNPESFHYSGKLLTQTGDTFLWQEPEPFI